MTESTDSKQHLVFAVLLGIAGLLIILIFVTIRTQGDNTNSYTTITDAAPSCNTMYITTTTDSNTQGDITLTENNTTDVYVKVTCSDNNGCDDIATTTGQATGVPSVKLYRSGVAAGVNCSANNLNCYQPTCNAYGCTPGGSDTDVNFLCTSSLQYYTDNTATSTYNSQNWLASATTTDRDGSQSVSTTYSGVEVNDLTGLGLGNNGNGGGGNADVPYGTLALGATSSDVALNVKNTGNTCIMIQVSGTDMTCPNATVISVGQQKASTSTGVSYGSKLFTLSTTATNISNACLAKASQSADSTTTIFWMVQLPSSGVAGTCTGTNTLNAAATS